MAGFVIIDGTISHCCKDRSLFIGPYSDFLDFMIQLMMKDNQENYRHSPFLFSNNRFEDYPETKEQNDTILSLMNEGEGTATSMEASHKVSEIPLILSQLKEPTTTDKK